MPSSRPSHDRAQGAALPDFVLRQFDRGSPEFDHRQLYGILQTRHPRRRCCRRAAGCRRRGVLAQALGIARNTVVHVYEQLALEGYVQARCRARHLCRRHGAAAGAGRRCRQPASPATPAQAPCRGAAQHAGRRRRRGARCSGARSRPACPRCGCFRPRSGAACRRACGAAPTPQQLSYATGAGDAGSAPGPGRVPAGHARRGLHAPSRSSSPAAPSSRCIWWRSCWPTRATAVWLEDPGYWGARSVFRAMGLKLVPVAVDAEGMAPTRASCARRRARCSCRRRTSTRPAR